MRVRPLSGPCDCSRTVLAIRTQTTIVQSICNYRLMYMLVCTYGRTRQKMLKEIHTSALGVTRNMHTILLQKAYQEVMVRTPRN